MRNSWGVTQTTYINLAQLIDSSMPQNQLGVQLGVTTMNMCSPSFISSLETYRVFGSLYISEWPPSPQP